MKDRETESHPCSDEIEPEPPKKKVALLLLGSESESDEDANFNDKTLATYRAEPSVSIDTCSLQWWSAHTGADGRLAQNYLAGPALAMLEP